MVTLGVDLAASPNRSSACLIDWDVGTVRLLPRPVTDEALVEAVAACDVAALDVPLGWPEGFVEAVVSHLEGRGWPPTDEPSPADRAPLRFRATDRALRESGHRPLSVSTDRIGVTAMRGARLLELLARSGVPIDRSGVTGRVVEVYPAAALRAWGLPSTGYKGSANRRSCTSLMGAFAAACGALAGPVERALVGGDDDDLDAVVCSFVARAVLAGRSSTPPPGLATPARREGWIHLPTITPAEIASTTELAPR